MKLYHGTSESRARRIIQEGLKPRGDSAPNFPELYSYSDMVYLTTYAATSFAWEIARKKDERWAVIEVDATHLDEALLYPDQGFIAAGSVDEKTTDSEVEALLVRAGTDIDSKQHLWRASLNEHGVVAFRSVVQPEFITRVVVFDPKVNPSMVDKLVIREISAAANEVAGRRLKAGIKWLFSEPARPLEFFSAIGYMDVLKIPRKVIYEVQSALANREGVELIYEKQRDAASAQTTDLDR